MQPHRHDATSTYSPCVATPAHCPACDDLMVAPECSEFVDRGEIRHRWRCESCGQVFETSFSAADPMTLE